MHTGFWGWRHAKRAFGDCGNFGGWAGFGPGVFSWEWGGDSGSTWGFGGGGAFGVRRPLRFLVHKLGLNESQIPELARILDELKTERAQAEVDRRRTMAALADAVAGDSFNDAKAAEGGDLRAKSAEHLRDAVLKALRQIHALLNPEQRAQLAYLIRTGALVL
jgi:Spy/CpxP family protein refolding chaperone